MQTKGRLRRLSAWELCQARQEAALLFPSGDCLGLCLNACVLARALQRGKRAVFASGEELLQALPAEAVTELMERYVNLFLHEHPRLQAVNPHFDNKRFEELKCK